MRPSVRMPFRFAPIVLLMALPCPAQAAWLQNGVPLCTETHSQTATAIVTDGAQGAVVLWNETRFGDDIYAQRVDGNGVVLWSGDGVAVCTASGQQNAAAAVSVPGGGAFCVWEDHRGGSDDIYAQRIDGSGLSQWTGNGIALGSTSDNETGPRAISDFSSGVIAPRAWLVMWIGGDSFDSEIRVQRVNADGVGLWTTAASGGVVLASGIDQVGGYGLASDGLTAMTLGRGAVTAWSQQQSGSATGYDVYARRVNAAGVPQWASNGVPVCALTGDQQFSDIVNVGTDLVILAWDDTRDVDKNLWAHKLNSAGTAQWLGNGLPICRASGAQSSPKLVSDGAGGVIAVWQDQRSGTTKVYAQRLDGNGQRLWMPEDGIPICGGSGAQTNPTVVTDGAGGAIVTWQDFRHPTTDVYAQRVDPNGNLLWTNDGIPLVTETGNQEFPRPVSDGMGGAVVAWNDLRSVNRDVYANRITSAGGVVGVQDPGAPAALRLAFVSSNPSRGDVRMRLDLPEPARVTAEVLDVQGRRVRSLCAGSTFGAGAHTLTWDGTDETGARAPAGVFFARVKAGAAFLTTRMVRMR